MINCKFCSRQLEGQFPREIRFIHYWCEDCKTNFEHHILNGPQSYDIYDNGYCHRFIPKNIIRPKYLLKYDNQTILTLDHLPDIKPSTVKQWTQKLLKMKAFI
jgi:hypothetical protein